MSLMKTRTQTLKTKCEKHLLMFHPLLPGAVKKYAAWVHLSSSISNGCKLQLHSILFLQGGAECSDCMMVEIGREIPLKNA
jgi:hypothetical protein